jgi:hypothetical protein
LLAESGLGKSTLLIEAEHLIASADDSRIPLRLAPDRQEAVRDDTTHWVSYRYHCCQISIGSRILAALLAKFAEQLLGEILQ